MNEWIHAGGSAHLQALLKERHIGTWASTEGLAGVIQFQSGTLAGTPAADLVFIAAFARVLKKARRSLDDAGLTRQICTEGADTYFGDDGSSGEMLGLRDADYMDDTVFPLIAPASELVRKVSEAIAIITNTFARYGFSVNFVAGKTEAVGFFDGDGAIRMQRALAGQNNKFACETKAGPKELRVVTCYKHLGTKNMSSAEILPEIKTRIA